MQETLKQVLEFTVAGISIFGENTKFKYVEQITGTVDLNVEFFIVEERPVSRTIFRKYFTIIGKENHDLRLDLVRADFLREVVAYAVQSARSNIDKIRK